MASIQLTVEELQLMNFKQRVLEIRQLWQSMQRGGPANAICFRHAYRNGS